MLKYINTYFGNAYIRFFFFFFLGAKICHVIMLCNTDKTTLFFVIYDLRFHEFVLMKPNLNNLTVMVAEMLQK